ncbi:MAG TPA: methylmalonyl Co-A mutase-associated GTPase MeaB, partial [Marmoricola sp.]
MSRPDVEGLLAGVRAGKRAAVSRAITLVESARSDHRTAARELLGGLGVPDTPAIRVGISGVPGV